MKRLKAKVNGRWITGENAQQLVNNVLKKHVERIACGQSVKDYSDHYLSVYKMNGTVEVNTIVGYIGYLKNHIIPVLGAMDLTEISIDVVQNYINEKSNLLAGKTIAEHITLMAEIFDAALEDNLIPRNPFRSKRLKIIGKASKTVTAYSEGEFSLLEKEVLPKLHGIDKLFVAITLYTGMRQGEICALRWEDIDFEYSQIYITKSIAWPGQNKGIIKRPKSKNGIRSVIILPQLIVILESDRRSEGYVIHGVHSTEDEPITRQGMKRLNERVARVMESCGIDFQFSNRRGRHTIATFMNNANVDDKTIESQLGHYSADFTRRQYMNADKDQIERSMKRLSEYMSNL